jgi:hypothetical protein
LGSIRAEHQWGVQSKMSNLVQLPFALLYEVEAIKLLKQ